MYVSAFGKTLDCFIYDLNADEPMMLISGEALARLVDSHEKDSVGKAGQGLYLGISIWKPGAWRPLTHDRRTKANDKS